MKSIGTLNLETKRLVLRRFTKDDAACGFKNWTSDANVTKYLTWKPHASILETESIFEEWQNKYVNDDFYQWAIILKEIEEPIGSISVVRLNKYFNSCEVGYVIGPKWWGKGIIAEAFKKVIEFLFEKVEVGRIAAVHDINNPNSGRVMEKCGLIKEGVLRRSCENNTGICDAAVYSILDDEYFERLRENIEV